MSSIGELFNFECHEYGHTLHEPKVNRYERRDQMEASTSPVSSG